MTLDRAYHAHGISFRYPGGWELTEESRDDALTVSVGDDGPFWSVTILRRRPRAERVLEEATSAFRDEYDELDEYPATASLGGQPAAARNLEFVSLELINCVQLRAQEAGGRTLFVLAQVTDHQRDEYEPTFQAISDSLRPDADEDLPIV